MRNLFLTVLLLSSICFSQNFGLPQYLWQTTYALNVTQGQPNLPRNHGDANRFVSKIHSAVASKYSSINLLWANDLKDANATYSSFSTGISNNSEMFYFAGHGNYGTIRFYESEINLGSLVLTGWTRWGFLVSCLTLNQKDAYHSFYNGAFSGGIHALLGYESDHRWYIVSYNCSIFGCSHYRSEDKWDRFAQKWITDEKPLVTSWMEAVKETSWNQAGQGISPAIVYTWGYVGGVSYSGAYETLPTMYNGIITSGVWRSHHYVKYGTPYYGGVQ